MKWCYIKSCMLWLAFLAAPTINVTKRNNLLFGTATLKAHVTCIINVIVQHTAVSCSIRLAPPAKPPITHSLRSKASLIGDLLVATRFG